MTLYSCTVTDCMESWQNSLHKTKKGAWKAGNDWLKERYNQSFERRALIGKDDSDFRTEYCSFNVYPVEVLE